MLHLWPAKCEVDSQINKLLSLVVSGFISLDGVGGDFLIVKLGIEKATAVLSLSPPLVFVT